MTSKQEERNRLISDLERVRYLTVLLDDIHRNVADSKVIEKGEYKGILKTLFLWEKRIMKQISYMEYTP